MKSTLFTVVFCLFTFIGFSQEEEEKDPLCDYYAEKGISANKKAIKLYLKGKDLFKDKKIKDARLSFVEALTLDPEFAHAHFMLGELFYYAKNYKAARKHYLDVIEICPDFNDKLYHHLTKAELTFKYMEDPLQVYKNCAKYADKYLEIASSKKSTYEKMAKQCMDCKNYVAVYSNPVPFNPNVIKGIENLGTDEYMPIISPDNELLYFTKRFKEEISPLSPIKRTPKWIERFMVAKQTDEGYSFEEEMPGPFNKGRNQGGASLTIDNKEMYITICNDPNNVGGSKCDIYVTTKVDTGWTQFVNLNDLSDYKINTANWEAQPSISPDGQTLYFASDQHDSDEIKAFYEGLVRSPDNIDSDIYMVKRQENGRWGKPEQMGPHINTDRSEESPFIHQDNQTFYFASAGHLNIGDNSLDIFISRKQKGGTWGPAINIGVPINTPAKEADFFVSTNGKSGYYSAKIDGTTKWDIYEFKLYGKAQPKALIMRKGQVVDDNGNPIKDAKIKLRNNKTNEEIDIDVDKETGEYVFIETVEEELEDVNDAINLYASQYDNATTGSEEESLDSIPVANGDTTAEGEPIPSKKEEEKKDLDFDYSLTVQKEGHFYDSENITSDDPNALEVGDANFQLSSIKKGATFEINNILFETDSYDLKPKSKNELLALADFLRLNKDIKMAVHGHTDNVGNFNANITLSENRAKEAYLYLIEQGIAESRLSYKGFGSKKPVASNNTEEGRAKNRRTEVVIL